MNIQIIEGRLTKDLELNFLPGKGTAVATFSVAVNDGYGEYKKTLYFNVKSFGKQAENISKFLVKGKRVLIKGKGNPYSYDGKDGSKKYSYEIVADMMDGITFLDSKGSGSGNESNNNSSQSDFYDDMTPVEDGDMPF